jgi:hypothetical protein
VCIYSSSRQSRSDWRGEKSDEQINLACHTRGTYDSLWRSIFCIDLWGAEPGLALILINGVDSVQAALQFERLIANNAKLSADPIEVE